MTTISRRAIRKALETPLGPALIAGNACPIIMPDTSTGAAILYPDIPLETAELQEYVRFTVHYANPRVMEIGNHPRTQDAGFALCSVYTRKGTGADRNDTIAGIVEAAYPYNAALTHDGVTIYLAETASTEGTPDGPWFVSQVLINWTRWRNL